MFKIRYSFGLQTKQISQSRPILAGADKILIYFIAFRGGLGAGNQKLNSFAVQKFTTAEICFVRLPHTGNHVLASSHTRRLLRANIQSLYNNTLNVTFNENEWIPKIWNCFIKMNVVLNPIHIKIGTRFQVKMNKFSLISGQRRREREKLRRFLRLWTD